MSRIYKTDCISIVGTELATGVIIETIQLKSLNKKLDKYFINIDTIIRNALDCVPFKKDKKLIMFKNLPFLKKVYSEVVLTVNVIKDTFANSDCELIFYDVSYKQIGKKLPNFKSIDNFKSLEYIRQLAIMEIKDMVYRDSEIELKQMTYAFPVVPNNKLWAITTHSTIELLNYRYKPNVLLLESFTGQIKRYKEWYTKYHPIGKKDMSVFPFNDILYFMLGDKYFISPLPVSIRHRLYKLALDKNWNFNSSRVKVKEDIRYNLKDVYEKYVKPLPRWFYP